MYCPYPKADVEFSGDSTFVQVVKAEKPEQKFEKRAVKVGLSDGIKIEIKEGLAENERYAGRLSIRIRNNCKR